MKKRFMRILALLSALILILPLGVACGQTHGENGKINILCTTFPLYDWTKNVVGESDTVTVELLVSSGTDPHSFQPSVADIAKISESDLLIHVGGYSDAWIQDAAKQAKNTTLLTVSEIEGITLISLEGEEHTHSHEEESHTHGDFDEHIWLSLKNAMVSSQYICDTVVSLDSNNAEYYKSNLAKYLDSLTALDAEYEALITSKPLVFADRFPFRYLTSDYDIGYFAAFEGCSSDVDASFETVIELAKAIDENTLAYILVTESSDKKLAEGVIAQTQRKDAKIAILDSMQSATLNKIQEGYTYISAMKANLETLKTVLK